MSSLSYRHWLVSTGIFLFGTIAVLEINDSPFLPSVHADSVEYMEAGASLSRGEGLRIPFSSWMAQDSVSTLSHFPPGMSVAIGSIMSTAGVRQRVAALWTLAIAGGMTLALAFLAGTAAGGWGAGLLAAILVGTMPPFVQAHTAVWSEPLYLAFTLLTLLLMLKTPDRYLVIGCSAAATVLIRYLGTAVVAAVGIRAYLRTRSVKKALLSAAPGIIAFLAWTAWARTHGESVRTFGEYSMDWGQTLAQLPGAIRFWLAPGLPAWTCLPLLALVVLAFWKAPRRLAQPVLVLIGAHILVIAGSRAGVDAWIPLDARMLMPVFALTMLPVAAALAGLRTARLRTVGLRTARLRIVGIVGALSWALLAGMEDARGIRSIMTQGSYYSSAAWLTSPLIQWVENRSTGLTLYSNEPAMMHFLSGRHARRLPLATHDFEGFLERWQDHPGAIVVVSPMRPGEILPDAYAQRLPLAVAHRSRHGVVLVPASDSGAGEEEEDASAPAS